MVAEYFKNLLSKQPPHGGTNGKSRSRVLCFQEQPCSCAPRVWWSPGFAAFIVDMELFVS